MYKKMKHANGDDCTTAIKKIEDGSIIPFDEANTDYQAYLKWLDESPDNAPLPADE